MSVHIRLPKRQYEWYRQAYGQGIKTPVEPVWPTTGIAAKLKIETDKSVIHSNDGADDAHIIQFDPLWALGTLCSRH